MSNAPTYILPSHIYPLFICVYVTRIVRLTFLRKNDAQGNQYFFSRTATILLFINIFRCNKCDKHFVLSREFRKHRTFHSPKRFECIFCKHKFSIRKFLRNHIRRVHSSDNQGQQYDITIYENW